MNDELREQRLALAIECDESREQRLRRVGAYLIEKLESGVWLCPCGPAYIIDGQAWAYSSFYGWHDPETEHDALWPVDL